LVNYCPLYNIITGITILMTDHKLITLSKFGEKYFYLNDKVIIIVPDYIKYWDNFYAEKYAKYLKAKFIWTLKNINLN
jgi:hypothetical protein